MSFKILALFVIFLNMGLALWFFFDSSKQDHMDYAIWHLVLAFFIYSVNR